jgi:hypothetical protein
MELPSLTPLPSATPDLYETAWAYIRATTQAAGDAALTATSLRPTNTVTPTPSDTPTFTATSYVVATELAIIRATNDAAQQTLAALQTQVAAPTVQPSAAVAAAPRVGFTATTASTPTITPTPTPTVDPVMPMEPLIVYARLPADLHTCPERACPLADRLALGAAVIADGMVSGENVDGNNNLWYRVSHNGAVLYVYSVQVVMQPPTSIPIPGGVPPEATEAVIPNMNGVICPRNCEGARAMGLSPQQAAQCGLDRDGDGVACYGD